VEVERGELSIDSIATRIVRGYLYTDSLERKMINADNNDVLLAKGQRSKLLNSFVFVSKTILVYVPLNKRILLRVATAMFTSPPLKPHHL